MHLDEEQRRAVIERMEISAAEVGFDLYETAQRLLAYADRKRPYFEAMCSREALDAYLAAANATDEAEIFTLLALLRAFPKIAETFVTEVVVTTAASIPAPVGPPRKLTPEVEREIIVKVGKLHTDGVRLGIAQSRVAQQLGIGKRTVQAVWAKRQHLAAQPFQSINDVWKFFEKIRN